MHIHEADLLDLTETLERVEGDFDLLKEMVELFLEEWPNMLSDIERAIAVGDARALQHAAHTLKGSVSNFAAPRATAASLVLEKMGRQQDLSNAGAALASLQQELKRLTPVLEALKEQEAA